MEQLKIDLDTAGKQKDIAKLQKLELEMDHANLKTVGMYNRLVRSYLWSDSIELAEQVLLGFEERELVPTTRTFTYLIQAYLKKNQLDKAKDLFLKMKDLSLHHRLRNEFDCSIMMKYYKECGDSYALDFLWRDMMNHVDIVKPGVNTFTQYLEHVLEEEDRKLADISQLSQEFILTTQQQQQDLNLHQYVTWMKVVKTLDDTQKAESLLLLLIKKAPPKISWDIAKDAIKKILDSYLMKEQDLKTLQKMG
ncbi:hypothetical protein ABG067_008206, partial [Albugo candida]